MEKHYTFHHDPGHGWLQVPLADLDLLGIRNKISPFSYLRGGQAFLEEDCDASYFLFKAEQAGWKVTYTEKYHERFSRSEKYPFNSEYNYEANTAEMYGPKGLA